jgi:hypothetical protein
VIEIDFLPDRLLELIPVGYQSKPNAYTELSNVRIAETTQPKYSCDVPVITFHRAPPSWKEKTLAFIRHHSLFYRDNGKLGLLSTPKVVTIGVCSSSFEFAGLVELLSYNDYAYKMFEQGDPSEVFIELDVPSIARLHSNFSTSQLLNEVDAITGEAEECFAITSLPYQELFKDIICEHWS